MSTFPNLGSVNDVVVKGPGIYLNISASDQPMPYNFIGQSCLTNEKQEDGGIMLNYVSMNVTVEIADRPLWFEYPKNNYDGCEG